VEARKERIDNIRHIVDKYVAEDNPTLKALLKKEIEIEIAEDKPYSMHARTVYETLIQ
jgi:hypothetical protein